MKLKPILAVLIAAQALALGLSVLLYAGGGSRCSQTSPGLEVYFS